MQLLEEDEAAWLDDEQQELVEELKMDLLEDRRKQREQSFQRPDEVRGGGGMPSKTNPKQETKMSNKDSRRRRVGAPCLI